MAGRTDKRISTPEVFQQTFAVSRETLDRLATYEALLKTWQRTINLVAPSTLDDVWHRHFADSAQLVPLAPADARIWVDVGSGAGFPGLVCAILLAEKGQCRVSLVESDTRKAAFLSEVARKTGVAVEIVAARIENIATQAKFGAIDVLSARALAPLDKLLELVAPMFSANTTALLLKGRDAFLEIEEAQKNWSFDAALTPSLTESEARVAAIRNLQVKTEG
jgi:16S rRNA (guanine527-N7)-methyltransferase